MSYVVTDKVFNISCMIYACLFGYVMHNIYRNVPINLRFFTSMFFYNKYYFDIYIDIILFYF